MDEAIFSTYKDLPQKDKEGVLIMHKYSKVADHFYSALVGILERGKLAQHKIELDALRDENAVQRAKRLFF